jgi:nucleoside-diphosphate-sugar epimerase
LTLHSTNDMPSDPPGNDLVLVTGASGFIAKHVISKALARGYRVRGTLRRPAAEAAVRAAVGEPGTRLSFATADLLEDAGWAEAVAGCRFVCHVASVFPLVAPADRQALVPAARDGTLRVLRAAVAAGVERTVLTSSCVAIWGGHKPDPTRVFTEADWSLIESPALDAYGLSKTIAEREAWNFVAAHGAGMSLTSINPSMVMGPPLDDQVESSGDMIRAFLRGRYAVVPNFGIEFVDVRDVAEAHMRALEVPAAGGHRFIVSSCPMTLRDVGRLLGREFPQFRSRMPRATLPDIVSRVVALFEPGVRQVLPDLGPVKRTSTAATREILGLTLRSPEEAILAMANAVIPTLEKT